MKKFIMAFIMMLMMLPMTVMAASNQVSVGVKDVNGDIIQYATAKLKNDSHEYTKLVNSGMGEFFNIEEGIYTLTVTADTFNSYVDEVTITAEENQDINIILTKVTTTLPEEFGSKLNVTINYYDEPDSAHFGNKPSSTVNHSYDLHLNVANDIEVELIKNSYVMDAMLDGVTIQQKHMENNGVIVSVTAVKEEYNIVLYVQKNYTSRLYVLGAKYEDNTWASFNGYTHYLSDGVNAKVEQFDLLYDESFSVTPEKIDGYDYYPVYVLYYVNGGTFSRTTLAEWGLSMNNETGEITGNGYALSGNEYLLLYYYYVRSEGEVVVNYVDENGKALDKSEILIGKVGDNYETTEKEFNLYLLKEVEGETTGTYINDKIEITYIYQFVGGQGGPGDETVNDNIPNTGIEENYVAEIILAASVTLLFGVIIFRKKFN